ncbi:MAG: hypothetical protein CVU55_04910 [Deltaproteobacteria bacterium HGW-Deltaproteobacteria-13]|nr:MAG: hypothetical protein CVU55_04910 [Deltaproteobacteria bacterium HGW-Deltaproteobacteria-13]
MRKDFLSVVVRTECAHCGKAMELEIDSDLNCRVKDEACNPVVFVPDVNLIELDDESIINAF